MADWTVLQLIDTTADLLAQRGSPSPKVDAQVLLSHVLGENRTWLYMNAHRPVDDAERETFRALVARRAQGEPVAYLLGSVGFWTIDLAIDPRALVPRPETERVVELAIAFTEQFAPRDWKIVDVGTGSGAIALALASALPEATVLAIDLHSDALDLAKENAETLDLRERVRFACGDLLTPLGGRADVVDMIVSNPPYVGDDDPELEDAVRSHEPHAALFGGPDGLAVIRRLLPQAAQSLRPGGVLLMEFGARQGASIAALAKKHFADVRIEKDFAGLDRVLVAQKAGKLPYDAPPKAAELEPEELSGAEDAQPVELADDEGLSDHERMLAEAEAHGIPIISLDDE